MCSSDLDNFSSGGNVVLASDDMAITGQVVAGNGATVVLQPHDPARGINIEAGRSAGTLSLNPAELAKVMAGTLKIGRADATGTVAVSTLVGTGDVSADTLRLVGNDINIFGGAIGSNIGPFFDHHVQLVGNRDVYAGSIYLADNRNLTVIADRDHNLHGNAIFSGKDRKSTRLNSSHT